MKIQSQKTQSTSFKLLPTAKWQCYSPTKCQYKNIMIAEIEKRDLNFIQKLKLLNEIAPDSDKVKNAIIWGTLTTIEGILTSDCEFLDKIKMYIAILNNKPSGLLIGNMPKRILSTEGISYSSRHNNAKKETEIDWLATWTPKDETKVKGIGKALVAEFFGSLKRDGFRDVFVKSEIPENSYAQAFYESLGFEAISEKRPQLTAKTTNQYIVTSYDEPTDRIVPMIIPRSNLRKCYIELAKTMNRQKIVKKSIDPESIINIKKQIKT